MIYYLLTIKSGSSLGYKVLKGKTYEELKDKLQEYTNLSEYNLVKWEEITSKETKSFIDCLN